MIAGEPWWVVAGLLLVVSGWLKRKKNCRGHCLFPVPCSLFPVLSFRFRLSVSHFRFALLAFRFPNFADWKSR
jgi:hypothetical protein